MRFWWQFLLACFVIGLFYYNSPFPNEQPSMSQTSSVDPGSSSIGPEIAVTPEIDDKTRYAIVIAAGSTSSDIHVFKLYRERNL
jgi:hypothetical protein